MEVIYEEYEGDEAEEDPNPNEKYPNPNEEEGTKNVSHERHPSLSLYYSESDSDDSFDGEVGNFPLIGEWYSPENRCLAWNEEDREGLIEIALDGKKRGHDFHVEEENLIEIDISAIRNEEFPDIKLKFLGEVRFS